MVRLGLCPFSLSVTKISMFVFVLIHHTSEWYMVLTTSPLRRRFDRETVLISWNTGKVRSCATVFNFVFTPPGGTCHHRRILNLKIWSNLGASFRQVQCDTVNRPRWYFAQHVYCGTVLIGNRVQEPLALKFADFAQQSRGKCIYLTRKIWHDRIHHWYIPSCQVRPWSVNGNGYVSSQFQNLVNIVVFLLFFSPPPLVRTAYSSRCMLQRVEVSNATKTKYEFKYIDWNSRNVTPDFTENSKADRS